jgi:predicted ATP-binding protein involved in virulence
MRIDTLEVENFKGFAKQDIALHRSFNLLVGENGAGKTTILDALAVAAGLWLVKPPDTMLLNSGRNILKSEIHLVAEKTGDRVQFQERRPVLIRATGCIGEHNLLTWTRQIRADGQRTSNLDSEVALKIISEIYARDSRGEKVLCPIVAYYGAGRAWIPSNESNRKKRTANDTARRWAAFYDCFNERIRFSELREWFQRETIAAGNRGGKMRPGFEVVRRAIIRCIPDADAVWFDADRAQIVLSVGGNAQPFDNLSAGQRMMMALVADLAIKAITQNAFLVPPDELTPDGESSPEVLAQTPGLVLIDELDVHLHPRWQRRVATDLKKTFPAIQFVCTSHSPQIIGELRPEEIRLIAHGEIATPNRSYGIDSNRVLEELMDAKSRNDKVAKVLSDLAKSIDQDDFEKARNLVRDLEAKLGANDPEVTRANTLMAFLEAKP